MHQPYPDDLFKGTASYYARFRPAYPRECFEYIKEKYKLDGSGILMDLGCGTGQLMIPLSSYFKKVVGVDPEQEMLDEAKNEIQKNNVKNISLIKANSGNLLETCSYFGLFNLVTIGRAFHWMDQKQVLEDLDTLIVPGGGVAIISDGLGDDAPKKDWQIIIDDIKKKYLGEKRRAGSSFFNPTNEKFEDFLARSAFNKFEIKTFKYKIHWNADTIIGYLFSTSFASPALLGDKKKSFENELRVKLHGLNPNNEFIEDVILGVYASIKQ